MAPAKPLSADEIVKANAKKRANGVQMGGPAKTGRLDAATMAALGKRGPVSALGQLPSQGMGPAPGRGRAQPAWQAGAQLAGAPLCSFLVSCSAWTMPRSMSAGTGSVNHFSPPPFQPQGRPLCRHTASTSRTLYQLSVRISDC